MTEPDPNPRSSEPLMFVGLVVGTATAAVAVLVEAGLDLSPGLQTAIVGLIAALGVLVAAIWGRSKVYAPSTVARLLTGAATSVTASADSTTVTTDLPDETPLPPRRPGQQPERW